MIDWLTQEEQSQVPPKTLIRIESKFSELLSVHKKRVEGLTSTYEKRINELNDKLGQYRGECKNANGKTDLENNEGTRNKISADQEHKNKKNSFVLGIASESIEPASKDTGEISNIVENSNISDFKVEDLKYQLLRMIALNKKLIIKLKNKKEQIFYLSSQSGQKNVLEMVKIIQKLNKKNDELEKEKEGLLLDVKQRMTLEDASLNIGKITETLLREKEENKKLNEKCSYLVGMMHSAELEYQKVVDQRNEVYKHWSLNNDENKKLKHELDALNKVHVEYKVEIENLKARVRINEDAYNKMEEMNREIVRCNTIIRENKLRIEELKKMLAESEDRYNKYILSDRTNVTAVIGKEIESISKNLAQQLAELEETTTSFHALREQKNKLDSLYKESMADLQEAMNERESRITDQVNELSELNTLLSDKNQEIGSLKVTIESINLQWTDVMHSLQGGVLDICVDFDSLVEILNLLVLHKSQDESRMQMLREHISNLETVVVDKNNLINSLLQNNDGVTTQLMNREIGILKQENTFLRNKLNFVDDIAVDELNRHNHEITGKLTEVLKDFEAKDSEIEKLKKVIEKYKTVVEKLKKIKEAYVELKSSLKVGAKPYEHRRPHISTFDNQKSLDNLELHNSKLPRNMEDVSLQGTDCMKLLANDVHRYSKIDGEESVEDTIGTNELSVRDQAHRSLQAKEHNEARYTSHSYSSLLREDLTRGKSIDSGFFSEKQNSKQYLGKNDEANFEPISSNFIQYSSGDVVKSPDSANIKEADLSIGRDSKNADTDEDLSRSPLEYNNEPPHIDYSNNVIDVKNAQNSATSNYDGNPDIVLAHSNANIDINLRSDKGDQDYSQIRNQFYTNNESETTFHDGCNYTVAEDQSSCNAVQEDAGLAEPCSSANIPACLKGNGMVISCINGNTVHDADYKESVELFGSRRGYSSVRRDGSGSRQKHGVLRELDDSDSVYRNGDKQRETEDKHNKMYDKSISITRTDELDEVEGTEEVHLGTEKTFVDNFQNMHKLDETRFTPILAPIESKADNRGSKPAKKHRRIALFKGRRKADK